jgi:hypothetical protein
MGTRSLTTFIATYQENGKYKTYKLAKMYKQFDGHPERLGLELAEIIEEAEYFGFDCLVATIIANLKKTPGNVRLVRPGIKDIGEEFTYTIKLDKYGKITMSCYATIDIQKPKLVFSGTPKDFISKYSYAEL